MVVHMPYIAAVITLQNTSRVQAGPEFKVHM